MASTEEDFPRGGVEKKSTESKVVEERREVDNLFQVRTLLHTADANQQYRGGYRLVIVV